MMTIPASALSDMGYLPQPGQHRPPALIRAMREDPAAFIRGASVQLAAAQKLDCFSGPLQSKCLPSDPWPFTWVDVDKHHGTPAPETVTVWVRTRYGVRTRHGRVKDGQFHAVYRTLANTGILHSTPDGSWPIYRRYKVTTMQGLFPVPLSAKQAAQAADAFGGEPLQASAVRLWHGAWVRWKPYDDTGIKWVSYFDGGRALHFFPRARYGFPQSAGCVEMPLSAAHAVYSLTSLGTVVTVSSGRSERNSARGDSRHA